MRRTLLVMLVLAFALSAGAFGRSLGQPNELINGSWEFGDDTGWLRAGGTVADLTSYFGNPGPAPDQADLFGYADASCWGINQGNISQDVYVMPGIYTVDLSGWLRVMDGGADPSWIKMQLLVDDILVGEQGITLSGGDSGWQYFEVRWSGFVAGKKTVRIEEYASGWGGPSEWPWGIVCADGIDLEEMEGIIPEPTSILALAAGLAGLAIRRRR